jgi:hypothetical protein
MCASLSDSDVDRYVIATKSLYFILKILFTNEIALLNVLLNIHDFSASMLRAEGMT